MQDSTLSRRRMLALSAAASASAVMPLPGCSSDTPSPESESVEQIRARKQKEAAQAETDSLANLNLLMKAMAMYEASHARYPAAEAINSQWLEKANPDNDYKKVARIYKHLMQRLAVTEDTIADQLGLKVEDVRRKVNGLDYEYKRRKRRGLPVDASKYEPIPFYGMSWRVTLLPYVDRQDLYDEYRPAEPWNSLHNRKIMEQMPDIYRAPGSKVSDECKTNYVVPRGDRTAFPKIDWRGFEPPRIEKSSQTIAIVEVPDALAVSWTKPEDWPFLPTDPTSGLVGFREDGFLAAFFDGHVEKITFDTPLAEIRDRFLVAK